ncbi:MAG: hypothetical protein AB7D03_03660 [Thiomicrospira sp.]
MNGRLFNRKVTPYERGLGMRIAQAMHSIGFKESIIKLDITSTTSALWIGQPVVGAAPNFLELDYLARLSGVRFKWLVTGFGPMLKKKARKAESE